MISEDVRLAVCQIITQTYLGNIQWYCPAPYDTFTATRGAVRIIVTDLREICSVCGAVLPDADYCGPTEDDHVPGSVHAVVKYPSAKALVTIPLDLPEGLLVRLANQVRLHRTESSSRWPTCTSLEQALARFIPESK